MDGQHPAEIDDGIGEQDLAFHASHREAQRLVGDVGRRGLQAIPFGPFLREIGLFAMPSHDPPAGGEDGLNPVGAARARFDQPNQHEHLGDRLVPDGGTPLGRLYQIVRLRSIASAGVRLAQREDPRPDGGPGPGS